MTGRESGVGRGRPGTTVARPAAQTLRLEARLTTLLFLELCFLHVCLQNQMVATLVFRSEKYLSKKKSNKPAFLPETFAQVGFIVGWDLWLSNPADPFTTLTHYEFLFTFTFNNSSLWSKQSLFLWQCKSVFFHLTRNAYFYEPRCNVKINSCNLITSEKPAPLALSLPFLPLNVSDQPKQKCRQMVRQ